MTRRRADSEEAWTSQESVAEAVAPPRAPEEPAAPPPATPEVAAAPTRRAGKRATWLGPPRPTSTSPHAPGSPRVSSPRASTSRTSSPRASSSRAPAPSTLPASPRARARARALIRNLGPVWGDDWAAAYPEYEEFQFANGTSGSCCRPCGWTSELVRKRMNRHLLGSDHLETIEGECDRRLAEARAKLRRLGGAAVEAPAASRPADPAVRRGERVPAATASSRARATKRPTPTSSTTPITVADSDG